MAKTSTAEKQAEVPTRTFIIRDAAGEVVGEQTVDMAFAPILQHGQTAELKDTAEVKAARAEIAASE